MDAAEIEKKLRELVRARMDATQADLPITSGTRFSEDLNFDSLSLIELLYDAEDRFGIKFNDDEARRFTTVGDVIEYLGKQAASKAAPAQ